MKAADSLALDDQIDGPVPNAFDPNNTCVCGADAWRVCTGLGRPFGGLLWRTFARISWAVVTLAVAGSAGADSKAFAGNGGDIGSGLCVLYTGRIGLVIKG